MIIDDGMIKKLFEVRDSEDVEELIEKRIFSKEKNEKKVEERTFYHVAFAGAWKVDDNRYNVSLFSENYSKEHVIASTDNEVEAVELARKLASALGINFKGLIESTEDPLKAKSPKELSKEGEKDTKLQKLQDKSESKVNEQGDEEDIPSEEPEPEEKERPDVSPPIDSGEPEAPEITKEYVGNTEDNHYYLISNEDEAGAIEDLQIVDQEGVEKFSAKANSIPVENVPEFLYKGIKELRIQDIEFGIFERYLYPYAFEEEQEEEEVPEDLEQLEEEPEDEPIESRKNESVDIVSGLTCPKCKANLELVNDWLELVEIKKDGIKETKIHLIEMKITDHENNMFDVHLVDDGTMDTVVDINGKDFRFDSEFASNWREEDGTLSEEGLEQLALDALSGMEEEDYNELLVAGQHAEEGTPPEEEAMDNESKEKNEAKMGIDYVKAARSSMKKASAAMKGKDHENAIKALEDTADDCTDAAKALKKMKREDDAKAAAEKEKEEAETNKSEETKESKVEEGLSVNDVQGLFVSVDPHLAKYLTSKYSEKRDVVLLGDALDLELSEEGKALLNGTKETVEGYKNSGVRDGTGPAKDSAQRNTSDKGRRRECGEKCPKESKEVEESKKEDKEEQLTKSLLSMLE